MPTPKVRIMVFGTFDILHKGHLNFFKQARALSKHPFLIVSVARDVNVKKIKGSKPIHNEKQRLKAIKKISMVQKAILGGLKNHIPHILKHKPHIIALGYDQRAYIKNLDRLLTKQGLNTQIVRLKPFKAKIYKTSFLRRKI